MLPRRGFLASCVAAVVGTLAAVYAPGLTDCLESPGDRWNEEVIEVQWLFGSSEAPCPVGPVTVVQGKDQWLAEVGPRGDSIVVRRKPTKSLMDGIKVAQLKEFPC